MREAEAVGARNENEKYLVERMRIAAASLAGDADTAARSFEAISGSARISGPDKLRMIESIAAATTAQQQYAKATQWGQRYLQRRRDQSRDPHDADPEPVPRAAISPARRKS